MKKIFLFMLVLAVSCSGKDESSYLNDELYFPTSNTWKSKTPESLNWNTANIPALENYLEEKNTKGFIILHNGKIVLEKYFNGHSQNSNWYWASAGKGLKALLVGIAQEEGFLNINDKTSDYLGENWTSLTLEKENLITIKHQLTMTTGLDESIFANTNPNQLFYIANAGTRWAYHNAPYTLLSDVITNATNQPYNTYFDLKIKNKIGMNGSWTALGYNRIFSSTTRSMARFGLLISNNGKWENFYLLNDTAYFNQMINTSQNINNSYGYLWWLNGKDSFILPQSQAIHTGSMIENAPTDMFMALGANDQKIYIVPSKKIVVVRMGEAANESSYGLSSFDNLLWEKINEVVN